MSIFNELDSSYYIYSDGPFYGYSDNKNGVVALAFDTKESALNFIEENQGILDARKLLDPKIAPVSDSYEFMLLCARHGIAGIELLNKTTIKSFVFCVRLEEASSTLPTVLSFNKDGFSNLKTRFKEFTEPTYRTIKEWQRFDILDKASKKFAVNNPFANWEDGTFYEVRTSSDNILSLFNVPCLLDYNGIDGSIPFFTSIELAIDFLNKKEFLTHVMILGGFKSNYNNIAVDISSFTESYKIIRIDDIKERINEISVPTIDIAINPNGHRCLTGYITRDFQANTLYHGISGTWNITKGNKFQKKEIRDSWDGTDSFYWNQVNSFRLNPLDRSFSNDADVARFSEFNEIDLEDYVQLAFEEREYTEDDVLAKWPNSHEARLKSFCIIFWDSVTGEGDDSPLFFDSIFDLIIELWQYECSSDYPIRRDGAHHCNGLIAVPAAMDQEYNKNIHFSIKGQLIAIFKRIALRGYKPKDGDDLSCIVNAYYKTLHVDVLGYAKDILFQLDGEEREEVASVLDIPLSYLELQFQDAYSHLDSQGTKMAIERLGEGVWNKLSSRAKYFVSSSLSQLQIIGTSPQLDYSLISIGFVKALEFELGLIFKNFATSNNLLNVDYDLNDSGECALIELSKNQSAKAPTLGSMAHLIRPNNGDKNELRNKLGEYLDKLNCGAYLASKNFWKDGIFKITTRYRNGGAHDSSISMNTALQCLEFIIGTREEKGVLSRLLE